MQTILHAEMGDQFFSPCLCIRSAAGDCRRKYVVEHAEVGNEMKLLKHKSDVGRPELCAIIRRQ